jgi:hypothetical protein
MTIKVKLRQKAISGKRKSLYLDFYPPIPHSQTGALTRRQFLGLYIQAKANTSIDKQSNKEVLQLAEQIRSKREIELSKPEIYMEYEREQLKTEEKGERSFISGCWQIHFRPSIRCLIIFTSKAGRIHELGTTGKMICETGKFCFIT